MITAIRPPIALVALVAVVLGAGPARGEEIYSFVDADGVVHVTNVPQDPRFRRARGWSSTRRDGIHRIGIGPRRGRVGSGGCLAAARYDEQIRAAAERNGLPVPLLKAVMAVESNFDPGAVSEKGATGLMQLMPGTARDLSVADPHDPTQNIEGGARYLRQLHDAFGNDLEKVLAAYNAGPAAVRRCGGGVPPIAETQDYVRKVLARYDAYLKNR